MRSAHTKCIFIYSTFGNSCNECTRAVAMQRRLQPLLSLQRLQRLLLVLPPLLQPAQAPATLQAPPQPHARMLHLCIVEC